MINHYFNRFSFLFWYICWSIQIWFADATDRSRTAKKEVILLSKSCFFQDSVIHQMLVELVPGSNQSRHFVTSILRIRIRITWFINKINYGLLISITFAAHLYIHTKHTNTHSCETIMRTRNTVLRLCLCTVYRAYMWTRTLFVDMLNTINKIITSRIFDRIPKTRLFFSVTYRFVALCLDLLFCLKFVVFSVCNTYRTWPSIFNSFFRQSIFIIVD